MKHQAFWIRFLVLALALCMTVSAFAACSTEEEEATESTNQSTTSAPVEEETEFLSDSLGNDLNFDTTVRVLGDKVYRYQVYCAEDEIEGDPIKEVVYKRAMTVEERLGIEIEMVTATAGAWDGATTFAKEVEAALNTDPYDAMACYNLTPYMLAQKGYCANLYSDDSYLDLTAPWWPSALLDEILVNNTLYAVSESNDWGLLHNMMAMFFNVEMLEAKGMESPYDLVANNQWTIDKLAEMIKDTYVDSNGDSKKDADDIYGFVNATNAKRDAWFFALGYKYCDVQNGEIVSLLDGDHIQAYIDRMVDFYAGDDTMLWDAPTYGGISQDMMFINEKSYFYSSGIFMAAHIKDSEVTFEYGVVPLPKLNSEQDRYYTHLSNTYDTWCVSFNARDMELSTAFLECMASEAYRQVGPTYFDTYVKLRYASNEKLAPMYDLVRDSVTFDLIYLYSLAYGTNPKDSVKSCITNPQKNSWSSLYASNVTSWNNIFADLVATYAK